MKTLGAGELTRQVSGDRHWQADVTYRIHQGLPVFNKLKDPIELSETQKADFLSRPFKDKLTILINYYMYISTNLTATVIQQI